MSLVMTDRGRQQHSVEYPLPIYLISDQSDPTQRPEPPAAARPFEKSSKDVGSLESVPEVARPCTLTLAAS